MEEEYYVSESAVKLTGLKQTAQPAVFQSIDEQTKQLMRLGELVGRLHERLAPILSPFNESEGRGELSADKNSSVAGLISDNTNSIRSISSRVSLILESLEI